MPFPDESFAHRVEVVEWRASWAEEAARLADDLGTLVPDARAVDHIGSTSVPGLPAKDCLDMMVRVDDVDDADLSGLERSGYRLRPEPWNRDEELDGVVVLKRVFAPPVGSRSINVHVRAWGSPTARFALLFRDHLRAAPQNRLAWGRFKVALAATTDDLAAYGQVNAAAHPLLREHAERWASATAWSETR